MDEKNVEMTEEEIVASFECCRKNDLENTCAYCVGCPASNYYAFNYEGDEECIGYVMRKAIESIKRLQSEKTEQKAEIERLTKKAAFYYKRCKSYGIECFCDAELDGVEVE